MLLVEETPRFSQTFWVLSLKSPHLVSCRQATFFTLKTVKVLWSQSRSCTIHSWVLVTRFLQNRNRETRTDFARHSVIKN